MKNKLTFEELLKLKKKDEKKLNDIIEKNKKNFTFGINGHSINYFSLFLLNSPIEFLRDELPPEAPKPPFSVIANNKLSGTFLEEKAKEGYKRIIFYVDKKKFEKMLKEARKIYKKYNKKIKEDGKEVQYYFHRIPDSWFGDTTLIKFLNEILFKHQEFADECRRFKKNVVIYPCRRYI